MKKHFQFVVVILLLAISHTYGQWQITGNAGTNPATNFIGTTDNKPLIFRSNNVIFGSLSAPDNSVKFGRFAGVNNTGVSTIIIGDSAYMSSNSSGQFIAIGQGAAKFATNSQLAIFVGNLAGGNATTSGLYLGNEAGFNNGGSSNSFIGNLAGRSNTTGTKNLFCGQNAGINNLTGNNNTIVGQFAGTNNSAGSSNTFVGTNAGGTNFSSFNTFIGDSAGIGNSTGNSNVAIGKSANMGFGSLTNAVAIGANTIVTASNAMVLGNNVNVGIGVSAPLDKLHVVGNIRMVDGTQGAGKVLVSDANGRASWQPAPPATPAGPAAGDLIGAYPAPIVQALQGFLVSPVPPTNAQVLQYNGVAWTPTALPTALPPTGPASGDLTNTYPAPTVKGLQGFQVSATPPTNGQVLQYNGTAWAPTALPSALPPTGPAAGDLTSTYPAPTVKGLQGFQVSATPPTNGQVLQYNGTAWVPSNLPISSNNWSTLGNSGTTTTNFIGTTDSVAMNIKVNNQPAGKIEPITNGNTFLGYKAGVSNTLGTLNTFIGASAGNANTIGAANTFIGSTAGMLTTGGGNTFTGAQSGDANTTGTQNSFYGFNSGGANISGTQNSFFGNSAGINSTGSENAYFGYQSGNNATTATRNSCFGTTSGFGIATGSENVFIGYNAGAANSQGRRIVAVGTIAGNFNDSSSTCTFIGYDADQSSTSNFVNSTALGNTSRITASNQIRIGNATVTSIGGFVNYTNVSDARFKQHVVENVPGMAFINKLRPVTYTLDVEAIHHFLKVDDVDALAVAEKEMQSQSGFIAQEVEEAAKATNYNFSGVDAPKNSDDFYGLRYAEFVVPMVKGMQEMDENNKKLILEVERLNSRLSKLEALLYVQDAELSKINFQKMILESDGKVAVLGQNIPNPFTGKTIINYYLPSNATQAEIVVTTTHGIVINKMAISYTGTGSIEIDASKLAAGNYFYSLYINGSLVDTKQFVKE